MWRWFVPCIVMRRTTYCYHGKGSSYSGLSFHLAELRRIPVVSSCCCGGKGGIFQAILLDQEKWKFPEFMWTVSLLHARKITAWTWHGRTRMICIERRSEGSSKIPLPMKRAEWLWGHLLPSRCGYGTGSCSYYQILRYPALPEELPMLQNERDFQAWSWRVEAGGIGGVPNAGTLRLVPVQIRMPSSISRISLTSMTEERTGSGIPGLAGIRDFAPVTSTSAVSDRKLRAAAGLSILRTTGRCVLRYLYCRRTQIWVGTVSHILQEGRIKVQTGSGTDLPSLQISQPKQDRRFCTLQTCGIRAAGWWQRH